MTQEQIAMYLFVVLFALFIWFMIMVIKEAKKLKQK